MKELTLSEIWMYPIKSLGGIRLTSAKVVEKGLLHDRRWMLVDENNVFMTQRVYPSMALFLVSLERGTITITKRNPIASQPFVSFDINAPTSGQTIISQVWDDEVIVTEVDPTLSHWFSGHLEMTCKLVSFPEANVRLVDPRYKVNNEQVSLADAYPFLIIGQSSLDDLNARLKESLTINRFRPNFVFTGGEPYEEDSWKNFSIGKSRFVGVKPCSRCILTTVDQNTAERGNEPLVTLSTYRKRDNKIYFGQNLVALDQGEVWVGDKITLN
jgi:uncharacterized protein YcbX